MRFLETTATVPELEQLVYVSTKGRVRFARLCACILVACVDGTSQLTGSSIGIS